MEEKRNKIDIISELKRKAIHITSSWMPVSYIFLEKEQVTFILLIVVILSALLDIMRYFIKPLNRLYMNMFLPILRGHERESGKLVFTGATYLALSALLTVLIFPREIAIPALLILTISDSFAAIIGKLTGKLKIGTKSLEGSAAFFISGMIIILFTPRATDMLGEYMIGIMALFVTTIVEVLPIKIDDNILIPGAFALSLQLLYWFILKPNNFI